MNVHILSSIMMYTGIIQFSVLGDEIFPQILFERKIICGKEVNYFWQRICLEYFKNQKYCVHIVAMNHILAQMRTSLSSLSVHPRNELQNEGICSELPKLHSVDRNIIIWHNYFQP